MRTVTKCPNKRDQSRLARATKRAAKREVDQRRDPHQRKPAGETGGSLDPVGYQLLVVAAVQMWINKLAAVFRSAQELCLREIQKAADELAHVLKDLDANALLIPARLVTGDLHRRLVPAVVIAEIVLGAALWPLVEDLPLPLALLAAAAIATVTCMLAILAGLCLGACIFDDRDGPHELSPRQRALAVAGACVFGALVVISAVVLAVARGSWLLWLPLALVVAAVEITFGVARYEARHPREREALRRDCAKVIKEGRAQCVALRHSRETALGAGRAAVDHGKRILREGEVAFDDHWRTIHWKSKEPVPAVPQAQLPSDQELVERLLTPITPELKRVIDVFADGTAPASQRPSIPPQPQQLTA